VAAGASQQFTASTATKGAAVTWEVNGTIGGNSTVGTITQAGLYTAPQVPPSSGSIPIQAVLQSNTTEFAAAAVTITYSNFSLQHSYGFLLRGSDPSGLLLRAGSFTADGGGNITAGIEDINNGPGLVQSNVAFMGTYSIRGDGRGTITFSDPFNGNTAGATGSHFSVVIVSAQQVQLEEADTFAAASGEGDLQDTSSFATAKFHGEYTFDFSGVDAAAKPLSTVGQFLADGVGGSLPQAGLEDINDGGAPTSNSAFVFSYQSVGANGRGLATVNGGSFSFYMISTTQAQFIALSGSPTVAGSATLQAGGGFNLNSLGGNFLLVTNGTSLTGPISTAATFSANGNAIPSISQGLLQQNQGGAVSSASFTGTYSVAPSGRGTASFTSGQTYVFYLIALNRAVFQETDSSIVSDGALTLLAGGPFSTSNLAGGYAVQLSGVKAGQGEQDVIGQITTGAGIIDSGTVDVNTANGAGGMTAFTATTGVGIPSGTSYSVSNGQGSLQVNVNGTNLQFAVYFLSSNSLFLLRSDVADARVLHGNLFQDVSLSPSIVSANSVTFTVSVLGTFIVETSGSPGPITLTQSGTLPSGITFDPTTGLLSGIPTATGTFNLQFTASNGVGSTAIQNFTLTIVAETGT